jgi:hypothetical protein
MQISLKSDKNNGCTLREGLCTSLIVSRLILGMRCFRQKLLVKIKAHNLYSLTCFSFENHAVYEIMCKNNGRTGQATYDNMGHTHITLDT